MRIIMCRRMAPTCIHVAFFKTQNGVKIPSDNYHAGPIVNKYILHFQ